MSAESSHTDGTGTDRRASMSQRSDGSRHSRDAGSDRRGTVRFEVPDDSRPSSWPDHSSREPAQVSRCQRLLAFLRRLFGRNST